MNAGMKALYLVIPLAPLFGAIVAGLFGRAIGRAGAHWITILSVLVSFLLVYSTEVEIVQSGVPDVIPPEACYVGWQESLALLAMLVEPEIPG